MYHIEHTHKLLFRLNEPNMLCLLPSTWRYMSKAGTCFLLRNAAAALTVTTRHVLVLVWIALKLRLCFGEAAFSFFFFFFFCFHAFLEECGYCSMNSA